MKSEFYNLNFPHGGRGGKITLTRNFQSFSYLHLAWFNILWISLNPDFPQSWREKDQFLPPSQLINQIFKILVPKSASSCLKGFLWVPICVCEGLNTSNCFISLYFVLWWRANAFIRSISHSQNIAPCHVYIRRTNHPVPQLSPIRGWMDVSPHPGNGRCQKFIGFTDYKSPVVSQALCKLSGVVLWLGRDSGVCWSTLLTSASKYLKWTF